MSIQQSRITIKWKLNGCLFEHLNHYSTCYMHLFTHSIVYVSYAFGHFHVNNKHAHTTLTQMLMDALRAAQGSVSCPKTLQHTDWKSQDKITDLQITRILCQPQHASLSVLVLSLIKDRATMLMPRWIRCQGIKTAMPNAKSTLVLFFIQSVQYAVYSCWQIC